MRTASPACRLEIRYDSCVACAACPAVCHTLALRMNALELVLDESLCDHCGLCVRVCPVGALFLGPHKGPGAHDHEYR